MDRKIEKKRWTRTHTYTALIGGSILAIILYAVFGAGRGAVLQVKADNIAFTEVRQAPFAEYIAVDGTVLPLESIYIDAVEGGVIEKIKSTEGNRLRAGDTIMLLNNAELQMDFINRQTQILELLNEIETARLTLKQTQIKQVNDLADLAYQALQSDRKLKTNQQLAKENAISKNDMQQTLDENHYLHEKMGILRTSIRQDSIFSVARIRQMDFSVKQMQQNLFFVKQNLDNLIVRAPVAGQLTSFDFKVGQLIQKGQHIAQIDASDGFKVRAQIDEHYIARIFTSQAGTMELDGKTYRMHVNRINPQVNNGLFAADLVFEDSVPPSIKKGQNVSIRMGLGTQTVATVLPRGSYAQSNGGNWVFVLNPKTHEAERREIKLGRQNPEYFEVLDGLQPGDKVVVSSYKGMEDKAKLVIE